MDNCEVMDSGNVHKEIPGMYEGPVIRVLIKLALPIFAGMLFQLLLTLVDTLMISWINRDDPSLVGGVGLVFPILIFTIAIGGGLQVGMSSLVARSIGKRDMSTLNKTAESGLALAAFFSIQLVIAIYIFGPSIIKLMGAEGDYYQNAIDYLFFLAPAGVAAFVGMTLNGILQGEGIMKHVMISMILGTMSNLVLDPVFIFLLKLEVKGAALATSVAELLSVGYMISVFVRKKTTVDIKWKLANISSSVMKKILSIGIPHTLSQIMMSFSFLIFNFIIIKIDSDAFTAYSLCGRIDQVVLLPVFAIGSSLVTMVGQNFGRKKYRRVGKVFKIAILFATLVVFAMATLLFVLAPVIYSIFSNVEKVIDYSIRQTRIVEYSFVLAMVTILTTSFFQAVARPFQTFFLPLVRLLLIAVPAVILFVEVFNKGIYGVWYGLITANVLSAVISLFFAGVEIKKLAVMDRALL